MEYFDNDIMTIEYSVIEAEMNVMNAMYDHCQKLIMMYEYDTSDDSNYEMFMEASFGKMLNTKKTASEGIGSKVKSVFVTLWNLIRRFFRWIGKMIGRVTGFIKSLFAKTKKPASADQCAREAGIQPAQSNNDKPATANEAPAQQVQPEPDQPAQPPNDAVKKKRLSRTNRKFRLFRQKTPNDKPVSIELDIPTITKDIFVAYDSSGNITVDFHFARKLNLKDPIAELQAKGDLNFIKGKQEAPDITLFYLFTFASNNEYFRHLEEWVIEMNKIINNEITDINEINRCKMICTQNFNVFVKEISKEQNSNKYTNYSMTIDQLTSVQKRVNKLLELMVDFTISDNIPQFDKVFLNIISAYVTLVNNLQMGLNIMSNAILTSYTIDEKYVGQCNDSETLSKFVASLIDHGIPTKFVGYNVFLIMDKNWSGSDPKTNDFRPIWGQSRIVFKPSDKPDIVHKVALSNFGVQGNKNEQYVYKRISGVGELVKYFGRVEYVSSNGMVLDMERLYDKLHPSQEKADTIADNINDLIKKHNIDVKIGDLHPGNLAKSNSGDYAILDYGWFART